MAIADADTPRCSVEEWEHFRRMCSHGMLFEVMEWIEEGRPTLRPDGKRTSAFKVSIERRNHSLVRTLWERAWQESDEASSAVRSAPDCGSVEVFRYLVNAGCPLDRIYGYDLCGTHDVDLIRAGVARGVRITGPDGFGDAFVAGASRPLVRYYLEEHARHPELVQDAAMGLAEAIHRGKLRAVALLVWAGVDPFTSLPTEDYGDGEESDPDYPVMQLPFAPDPLKILPLLRLKPDRDQWALLLVRAAGLCHRIVDAVFALRRDGRAIIERDPVLGARILGAFVHNLTTPWCRSFTDEALAEKWCRDLIAWGSPFLARSDSDGHSIRRGIYEGGLNVAFAGILSAAWEAGDDDQRARIRRFAEKPKMKGLLKDRYPELYQKMGFEKQRKPTPKEAPAGKPTAAAALRSPARQTYTLASGRTLTREGLHEDVWRESAVKVARRYGISSSMLARICTLLDVPRPGRGYWAKPEQGRRKLFRRLKATGMGDPPET